MSNIYLLTFGGPSEDYHEAVNRLRRQGLEFGIFNEIFAYTEEDLKIDSSFWNLHSNFILNNKRGYGYWIWKPYLIRKTLERLNNGDLLLYLDCGCEINCNGREKFNELIEKVNSKLIIGTETWSNDCTFTKSDLSNFYKLDVKTLKIKHMQAGVLLMKKTPKIMEAINEWYLLCNNYHFIDDSPSRIKNYPGFVEHRHDQSCFNMVMKKHKLINYDIGPAEWGNGYHSRQNYLNNAMEYPLWYCRNKKGKSLKED